ncbi:MAG: hypothetical protein GEV04_15990 [Actinophytocola sp.]|nr:hypothetical protein [Actinophytocola sp.]
MACRDVPNKSGMDCHDDIPHNVRIRRLVALDPEHFHTDMRHVDIGEGVELSAISWGGPVVVETEPLLTRYLVTVPLAGEITVNSGAGDVVADTGRAVIIGPRAETAQRWSADAGAIWLHLAREGVEDEARHLLRAEESGVTLPERRPVDLAPSLDLTRAPGQPWRATLQRLVDLLDEYHPESIPPHRLTALRRDVVTGLLRATWQR